VEKLAKNLATSVIKKLPKENNLFRFSAALLLPVGHLFQRQHRREAEQVSATQEEP
jgi:hypothetical protein